MSKKIKLSILIVGIFLLGSLLNPSSAKALTTEEIKALIIQLQTQIAQLQEQLAEIEEEEVWCHTFNVNLRYGDSGTEVKALQTALEKEGFSISSSEKSRSYFGDFTASAVVEFQEKYASDILNYWGLRRGTGYVGATTRAKLNKLYGCLPPIPLLICESNQDCKEGYFCEFSIGACEGLGKCVMRPESCPDVLDPVCGCDNKTYSNNCYRKMTGVSKAYDGVCKEAENQPPVIDSLSGPTQLNVQETGTWTIKAHDPENGTLTYSVNWGDEGPATTPALLKEQGIQTTTFTHSYSKAGTYTVQFTVRDDYQNTVKSSTTVEVVSEGCHTSSLWSWNYCSSDCKCDAGQGDCDEDEDCNTGYCAQNVGAKYGQTSSMDVCEEEEEKSITVISPNGGEEWLQGSTHDITWSSTGSINQVGVTICMTTSSYEAVNPSEERCSVTMIVSNTGSYTWTIGQAAAIGDYTVKIEDADEPSIFDESNAFFSIVSAAATCTDTDGGKDYYEKGTVTKGDKVGTDECNKYGAFGSKPNILSEMFCDGDNISSKWYDCPYGCLDGACIDESFSHTCSDTDGGDVSHTKGTVTFDGQSFVDECRNMSIIGADLVEYYCSSKNTLMKKYYECDCQAGACVPGPEEDPISGTLSVDKTSASTGEDITLKITAQDDQGVSKVSAWYQGSWHTKTCPVPICSAGEGVKCYGIRPTTCSQTFTFSESDPGTYYYYGYVYGYKLDGTSEKAQTVPYYVKVNVTKPTITCADSDGGKDYYTKGTVMVDGTIYTDYCSDSSRLIEYSCPTAEDQTSEWWDLVVITDIYTCPYGCEDGACKPGITVLSPNGGEEWETGKKYTVSWIISGFDSWDSNDQAVQLQLWDSTGTNFIGTFCTSCSSTGQEGSHNWTIDTVFGLEDQWIKVEPGQYRVRASVVSNTILPSYPVDFSDGYFSIVSPTPACTDSDGGKDYYTKGKCVDGVEGTEANPLWDYCSSDGKSLSEMLCSSGNNCYAETYQCPYGCEDGACKPGITVLSPNGGEEWQIGRTYTIRWESEGVDKINIELESWGPGISAGGPQTWLITEDTSASLEEYSWTIEDLPTNKGGPILVGDYYRIRVVDAEDTSSYAQQIADSSDNYFSILAPTGPTIDKFEVSAVEGYNIVPNIIPYNRRFTVSWAASEATYCIGYGHRVPLATGGLWSEVDNLPTAGSKQLYARHQNYGYISPLTIGLQCFGPGGDISKTIDVKVSPGCTDSDEGKDYYVKGTVELNNEVKRDYCVNSNTLKEYYCSGVAGSEWIAGTEYRCPYGCDSGACLRQETKPDLVITSAYLSSDNRKLYYRVKNQGEATAEASISFFTVDGERGGTDNVPAIGTGTSLPQYFDNWQCGVPGKSYRIGICADWDHQIAESNEDNNCYNETLVCPGEQEDPISGTLSVSSTQVNTGENITLTIKAQDDQGVDRVAAYYQGSWHTQYCNEAASCSRTWTFSESSPGTKYYYGYLYGRTLSGSTESAKTVPYYVKVNVVSPVVACTDSDGGKSYYLKGKGTGLYGLDKQTGVIWGEDPNKCSARWDYGLDYSIHYDCCSDSATSDQLNEAYCDANGLLQSEGYHCPNGCKDGACVEAVTATCTDSDGGDSIYTAGYVKDASGYHYDKCTGDMLTEYVCLNNYASPKYHNCGTNLCYAGKCHAATTERRIKELSSMLASIQAAIENLLKSLRELKK